MPFTLLGAEPFPGFNGLWGHLLENWETAGRMRGSRGRTKGIPPAVSRHGAQGTGHGARGTGHRAQAQGHQGARPARTEACKAWNVSDQSEQTALQGQPGLI